jgi:hypothetical protein
MMRLDLERNRMTLTSSGESYEYKIGPPVGEGRNGREVSDDHEMNILYDTVIDNQKVYIFSDSVYWPCQR